MKKLLTISIILGAATAQSSAQPTVTAVQRLDPALDRIISPDAVFEKLAGGIGFAEGPVWDRTEGYLLFSDIPGNAVMKWSASGGLVVFRKPVFSGSAANGAQVGTNGLTIDAKGRLVAAEHGNRRISRTEKDGTITVLAERYQGKRLNSPNDLVVKRNGDVYFTDPDFGLRSILGGAVGGADPPDLARARELNFNGVYRVTAQGKLELLIKDLPAPNGLAFSPDEKKLYVANSRPERMWMIYDIQSDGTLAKGKIFADMTKDPGMGAPDGMKVDKNGNIFSTGPGGIVVLSPEGKHLGTIRFPEIPANLAWGDPNGKMLYVTARTGLYRIRTNVEGSRP
jgi:gluconolactonase